MKRLERLLITGANGGLGRMMRPRLRPLAKALRLSDLSDCGPLETGEDMRIGNIDDAAFVAEMVEGCDAILHLGGQATEAPWSTIRAANIDGVVNLYEAARKARPSPRIIFASSIHVVGFYRQSEHIGPDAPVRPDGFYGVSKAFGGATARRYHEIFGIETAILRIGSFYPEPYFHRMLSTWLSPDDLAGFIAAALTVPKLGCPIFYGVSNDRTAFWSNTGTPDIGWTPGDDAERFRGALLDRLGEDGSQAK